MCTLSNHNQLRFSHIRSLGNPYLHYNPEDANAGRENDGADGNRKKKERRGSRKDRPNTAGRRKKRDGGHAEDKEEHQGGGRVEYK